MSLTLNEVPRIKHPPLSHVPNAGWAEEQRGENAQEREEDEADRKPELMKEERMESWM